VSSTGPRFRKDRLASETYNLHERLGRAEAQEREVFGLPPSSPTGGDRFPHADSVSSIGSERWKDNIGEFSEGAEAIFKELDNRGSESAPDLNRFSNAHPNMNSRLSHKPNENRSSYRYDSDSGQQPIDHVSSLVEPRSLSTISESSSLQSIYQDETPQRSRQPEPCKRDVRTLSTEPETRTWRSTLSSSAYHSLLERFGEMELQRQDVIWELCEAERVFVKRLRTIIQLFIRPLRVQDSKVWISGVPSEVGRLFDWLEDIINMHAQLSSALHSVLAEQYPVVMRIAEVAREFVPRLEVHQPYLVRVESVACMINDMVDTPANDFGEFVRIQQRQPECRGWSLEGFLAEPVNRLIEYPNSFRVCHPHDVSVPFAHTLNYLCWM